MEVREREREREWERAKETKTHTHTHTQTRTGHPGVRIVFIMKLKITSFPIDEPGKYWSSTGRINIIKPFQSPQALC